MNFKHEIHMQYSFQITFFFINIFYIMSEMKRKYCKKKQQKYFDCKKQFIIRS